MEQKDIDIYEILKCMPADTELYTPMCGRVWLSYMALYKESGQAILVKNKNGEYSFNKNGKYVKEGEVLLFPSKEMRDWSKFAWKKGDVLVSIDGGAEVIFDKWYDETYTSFYCKHYLNSEDENNIVYYEVFVCTTARYSLEDKDSVKTYINTIEERLGGKFNRETLEIEKQPEFKNGDVLFVRCEKYIYIEIFNYSKKNGDLYDHASLSATTQALDISGRLKICKDEILEIRLATEEEKQQLFSALAKEGKAWDAEKKMIVDLEPKVGLKPFDKVLVRDSIVDKWRANLFDYIDKDGYYCCAFAKWIYCIPYEGNEHLLGTTKDVED